MPPWSFAIVSDIHVYSSGAIPSAFPTVVQEIAAAQPRFVVVAGDATVGNPGDGVRRERVTAWWNSFRSALSPLQDAGIPVLPIAGNHDYYTEAHREGYAAAWADVAREVAASGLGELVGQPPLSYWLRVDDTFLLMLHVVDQKLDPAVAAFAQEALARDEATAAALRLCCGHVPLVSMMGKTSETFRDQLGSLLCEGGVAAYFSGHEHLVWDQSLRFAERELRQIHVGTASGTYHYPLNAATFAEHCRDGKGALPYTGQTFRLLPGTRQQADKVTLTFVDIDGGDYQVRPLSLRDGRLVPFGEPAS
jgi:3',5'-cyclic AMP phosphodiesterase CpdA